MFQATIAASKWMCSQAKAPMSSASLHHRFHPLPMSSASLHHRFHPLHLLKIGQGNPSRAYLRGNKKSAEKTYRHPIPSLCSLFSDFVFILAIFTHSLIVFLALLSLFKFFSFFSFFLFCSDGVLSIKPSLIGFALHVMIGFSCCWNMVRHVGAVAWGIEACVAFVMRIFVKQIGVLGLSGGRSGYTRNHISFIQSLQKAHFFFFLFFCFLGFW